MAELLGSLYGTVVTHGANNVKGSWITLGTASADFTAILFQLLNQDANNTQQLTSLGINGVPILEDMINGGRGTVSYEASSILVPVGGLAGEDIQVQGQTNSVATVDVTVSALLLTEELCGGGSLVGTYGATLASSQGKVIDPGGIADLETKVELTSASGLNTATNFIGLSFFSPSTAQGAEIWRILLYVGDAGGTPTGIGFYLRAFSTTDNLSDSLFTFVVDPTVFAAGTRVWLGATCNGNDATDRILEAILHTYSIPSSSGNSPIVVDD